MARSRATNSTIAAPSCGMSLTDIVEDFLRYAQFERGLAKTTQATYRCYLHRFLTWLSENGYRDPAITAFNTTVLRRYLHAVSAGRRPRTVRSAFHPLRTLSLYLVRMGTLSENPCEPIALPKKDAAHRALVSDEEVRQLLLACERQSDSRRIALARAIISTLVFAGLRRQELLDLRVTDVQPDGSGSLLVRSGKGGKSRTVYPCHECLTALQEWIAVRSECTHNWLWARDRSHRMGDEGLASLVETVKATAGLAGHDNIKPHSLRHNCATRLMRNGADLRSIQAFLGHSQLETTAVYLHTDTERLRHISHLGSLGGSQLSTSQASHDTAKSMGRSKSDLASDFFLRRRSAGARSVAR